MPEDPARRSWRFIVEPSEDGQRLDQLIPSKTGLSRRKVREILQLGGVQANNRRVRVAGRTPRTGTEIRVTLDESLGEVPDFEPEVLFEDDWILAVNKPSGIPTQGTLASDRHDFFTLAKKKFAGQQLYLTHRLDTGTSGVILLAKGAKMAGEVSKLFRERKVKKNYLAAISGHMGPCSIDLPIGRLLNAAPVRFGCGGNLIDVKPSATNFYPADPLESSLEGAFWVVAEPLTGRTHQVRVHLAHLGFPVIGDVLYGGAPSSRLWLHAWKLELPHPASKELVTLQADIEEAQVRNHG